MHKSILILLGAALVLNIDAAAGAPEKSAAVPKAKKIKECLFPKSGKRAPDWVCTAQDDNLAVAAVGSFAQSDAGIEFMEKMASAEARVQLARKLHDTAQKSIKATGSGTNKNIDDRGQTQISRIIDESLQDTKILRKVYAPDGRLYVLIGFDVAAAQKLQAAISATYMQQKHD